MCSLLHLFYLQLCQNNQEPNPVFWDIGEQRDVQCDISDGKVALIYPIRYVKHTLRSVLDIYE